jgi:predicted lipoprotein with Yx(FWY)xxD motif
MKTTPKTLGFVMITVLVTLGSVALAYHNVFGVFTHERYGTFLTDTAGKTLYIFKSDTQGSGESTCYDGCASAWPPYIVSEAPGEAHDEVTGELGTITRKDGSLQATYNGWPLYYFAGDAAPGDANGQNVGEVWFVANVE